MLSRLLLSSEKPPPQCNSIGGGSMSHLDNKTDYEKTLLIYDWLLDNIDYVELPHNDDQTIYGALIFHKARCAGYAKTFVYLLQKVQIDAFVIAGESIVNDEIIPHTWVVAYIDSKPYYFDPTWDDLEMYGYNHDWFGVDYVEFSKNHISKDNISFATYNEYNYYVYNNMYLSESVDDTLLNIIQQQGQIVHLKCANSDVMSFVLEKVNDSMFRQKISEILKIERIHGMNIVVNEDVYCIHIEFL